MNQLLNEAIRIYLVRRGKKEQSLAESLDRLRAYRERDPEFRAAIGAFADAEASFADPLEGTVVRNPHGSEHTPSGPVQTRVQELLRA